MYDVCIPTSILNNHPLHIHSSSGRPIPTLPLTTCNIFPGITEARLRRYEFRSSLPVECSAAGDEDRLKREISKQATALTSQLSCIRDGTCKLEPPTVKGCHPRKKRDAPADKYGGLTYVEFEVSITRDSDSSRTTGMLLSRVIAATVKLLNNP